MSFQEIRSPLRHRIPSDESECDARKTVDQKQKAIAFVVRLFQDNGNIYGAHRVLFSLINRCGLSGFTVDVYCHASRLSSPQPVRDVIRIPGRMNPNVPYDLMDFYEQVKLAMNGKRYVCVIGENISPPLDILFLQSHTLCHRRYESWRALRHYFYFIFSRYRFLRKHYEEKWIRSGNRRILVNSRTLMRDIMQNYGIPAGNIRIVHPGVENVNASSKYQPRLPFTFGFSGVGFKRKSGYFFLLALRIVRKQRLPFKALIIYPNWSTKRWLVRMLVRLFGLTDHLRFIPFQTDMHEFYEAIDCLVLPSREESFGLVALEAMANRRLALVSSWAGCAELIRDGENGFIFDRGEKPIRGLARKMIHIIENARILESCAERGFETAFQYTGERTYRDFIQAIEDLV
jgi:glycosyltransferase involved in cell wall biosynthesis